MLQPVGLNNRLWGCQGILGCALAKVLQPPCQAGPPHAVPSSWAWRQGAGQHRPGCKGKKRKKEKSKLQKNPISFPLLLAGLVAAPSLHCRAGGHMQSFCLLLLYNPTGMPFGSFLLNSSEWGGFNEF